MCVCVCRYMDESYTLTIPNMTDATATASLTANTYFGVLRGLETFSQLILYSVVKGQENAGAQFNIPQVRDELTPPLSLL